MTHTILIIDDDKDFVHSLKMVLEPAGYLVVEAYSAKEGLEKALSLKPHLIILDVMMESETAGFHLAYQLTGKFPILMLTSIGDVKEISFDKETDAEFLPVDKFLEKPVPPKQLLETVRTLLTQKGALGEKPK